MMSLMKALLVIFVLLFIVGCGGNSMGSSNTITQGADGSGTAGGPYK